MNNLTAAGMYFQEVKIFTDSGSIDADVSRCLNRTPILSRSHLVPTLVDIGCDRWRRNIRNHGRKDNRREYHPSSELFS